MNHEERMLSGLPYKASMDGLPEKHMQCLIRVREYNDCQPDDRAGLERILDSLLGGVGKGAVIKQPLRFDYGKNTYVGENFFANYNLTVLDVARVTIGDNVMLAPNVSIYTAGHPVHPEARNSGYEYGREVKIGDNVWIGGNVVINPGVSVGSNSVIGSGSVITRDIPEWVIAAGNPCRVIRSITEEDRQYFYKNLEFDVEI